MKDRQKLRIIDGFRPALGTLAQQPAAPASKTSHDKDQSFSHLRHKQIDSDIAAALKASEQRLSALLHDRSRIGRELHDSVLQALYAIEMSLGQRRRLRKSLPPTTQLPCAQAVKQVNKLIRDIRRIILGVESDNVAPFSLASELRYLAQTFEQTSQMQIRVEIDKPTEEILTGEEARELVTITREALSNCVRHAHATRTTVALRCVGSRVRLSIHDNGSGFHVAHGRANGIGFAHMESRARKIGGRLNIRSTVGRGTRVTADIYLDPLLTMA